VSLGKASDYRDVGKEFARFLFVGKRVFLNLPHRCDF